MQPPGWMVRAGIAEQIEKQTTTTEPNTLADKIEVIHQCLQPIHGDELMPVFVFDDTDRWTAAADETIVSGFFGNAIRWLADLQASVVVATHTRYLESTVENSNLLMFLDTKVELPRIPSVDQLARILHQRVQIIRSIPMAMIQLGNSKMSWNRLQSTNSINSMSRAPRYAR